MSEFFGELAPSIVGFLVQYLPVRTHARTHAYNTQHARAHPHNTHAHGLCADLRQTWLGVEHQESVFALLSFAPPMPFAELHSGLLLPLHRLFFAAAPAFQCRLIQCLVAMLRRWAAVPWAAYAASPRTADPFIWAQLDRNTDYYLAVRVRGVCVCWHMCTEQSQYRCLSRYIRSLQCCSACSRI